MKAEFSGKSFSLSQTPNYAHTTMRMSSGGKRNFPINATSFSRGEKRLLMIVKINASNSISNVININHRIITDFINGNMSLTQRERALGPRLPQ